MKTAVMLAVVMVLGGCSGEEKEKPETGDRGQETGDGRRDARTQRELAAEIAGAEKLRKDEQEIRYGEIRASWLGKRVTWTVDVLPALCRSAESCHALPFDRMGADRAIVQGWMPRLRLDGATFAALEARCTGRARCPVTVEATVSDFTLSADEPTSLALADVVVAPPG
jgi:hypothetical protein